MMGGLAGADGICQTRANAAGLPGSYKAWLSDGVNDGASPSTRFRCRAASCSDQAYRLVDAAQTLIATNWDDLTDTELLHAINVTEFGDESSGVGVWTGTYPDGTAVDGNADLFNCVSWTDDSSGFTKRGITGSTTAVSSQWTTHEQVLCSQVHRLYCFQQQ
jgi:hypothetical protein